MSDQEFMAADYNTSESHSWEIYYVVGHRNPERPSKLLQKRYLYRGSAIWLRQLNFSFQTYDTAWPSSTRSRHRWRWCTGDCRRSEWRSELPSARRRCDAFQTSKMPNSSRPHSAGSNESRSPIQAVHLSHSDTARYDTIRYDRRD